MWSTCSLISLSPLSRDRQPPSHLLGTHGKSPTMQRLAYGSGINWGFLKLKITYLFFNINYYDNSRKRPQVWTK